MSATANGVDPALVTRIVDRVKSQGIFDQFRRDCLGDVDTKPAYQNLRSRVEGYVSTFLSKFTWTADMNKNQLRNSLRRQINESEMLASGVERIIEQVVDAQMHHIFLPRIEAVVKEYLHSDNASSSGDVKGTETSQPTIDNSSLPTQPGSSAANFSHLLSGVKGSPADSPLVGWNVSPIQSAITHPIPPPLPGDSHDQPKPPPLPDSSAIQEKPKPPPLPRSREASPPPLPPSNVPERKRTSSVSSTPSLDSVSSGPLSINSEEASPIEKPKPITNKSFPVEAKIPGKLLPGKTTLGKKRISIVKKVVVRKADGTKVVRVVRMDPTKTTAKKLLMRAAARASGDQGSSPKGKGLAPGEKTVSYIRESKSETGEASNATKASKFLGLSEGGGIVPQLGKRKHSHSSGNNMIQDKKDEVISSGEEGSESSSRAKSQDFLPFTRDEIAAAQGSLYNEGSEPILGPTLNRESSKEFEDVSSPGSAIEFEKEAKDEDNAAHNEDYFPDHSDSDSHMSDVTVSSVHTSDLSSFDDKISSSSSSSSSDVESDEDDTDDYAAKKDEDKVTVGYEGLEEKPISLLLANKPDSERSVSPASSGGKTSPRPGAARWRRQFMSDSEDEVTKAERRRKAETKRWIDHHYRSHGSKAMKAEAKEERAKRRQQMKEERDKEHASSPDQETKRHKRSRDDEDSSDSKLSKQQLKEQKLQEKRREAKRQRTLLSQSDDSAAPKPEAVDTVCKRGRSGPDSSFQPPPIYRQEILLKKRPVALIPFHYMLSFDLAFKQLVKKSQQRARCFQVKTREEKDGKKLYCRFSFQMPSGKKKQPSLWQEASAKRKRRLLEDAKEEFDRTPAGKAGKHPAGDTPAEGESLNDMDAKDARDTREEVQPVIDEICVKNHSLEEKGNHLNNEGISETSNDVALKSPEEEGNESKRSCIQGMHDELKETQGKSEIHWSKSKLKGVNMTDGLQTEARDEQDEEEMIRDTIAVIKSSENVTDETIAVIKSSDNVEDETHDDNETGEEISVPEDITNDETQLIHHAQILTDSKLEGKQPVDDDDDSIEQNDVMEPEKEETSYVGNREKLTIIDLEREEISSDEDEFGEPDRTSGQDQHKIKEDPPKLSSIFQQTEAISSDEELDDVMLTPGTARTVNCDVREEIPSEGEVDEEAGMLKGESITKLTEAISGDELSDSQSAENPPTPTMDEPTEFEGIKDETCDGQPTIPIVLVHSPKGGGHGKMRGIGHGYSSGSSSDADIAKRESTQKIFKRTDLHKKGKKNEEIEEGELDAEIEEGEVSEDKDRRALQSGFRESAGHDISSEEQAEYGKRPRRRTFSPHPSKEDEYFYFGLPKRARRQSPTSSHSPTPSDHEMGQTKTATRERARSSAAVHTDTLAGGSNKETEDCVPSALMERRSSRYSRRVSPPRRYSPSEQRTVSKSKGLVASSPTAPSPIPNRHETAPPPQQHRHFTRRMSGRDEERRPHRYEDMYYYDSKRSRSTGNSLPAANKHARRTSAEERKKKR